MSEPKPSEQYAAPLVYRVLYTPGFQWEKRGEDWLSIAYQPKQMVFKDGAMGWEQSSGTAFTGLSRDTIGVVPKERG